MTKKNTAEVANKIRADLVREKILKEESLPKAFEWDHPTRGNYYIPKGEWVPKLKDKYKE
jgi:hypothetical protein